MARWAYLASPPFLSSSSWWRYGNHIKHQQEEWYGLTFNQSINYDLSKEKKTYLILVPHGTFTQNWNLGTCLFLKSLDCAALRSQKLSNKVDLEETFSYNCSTFNYQDKRRWLPVYRNEAGSRSPFTGCHIQVKKFLSIVFISAHCISSHTVIFDCCKLIHTETSLGHWAHDLTNSGTARLAVVGWLDTKDQSDMYHTLEQTVFKYQGQAVGG